MILQRYTFGSKSQRMETALYPTRCCLWYCKDIHLEANHNELARPFKKNIVAYDIAKIYIWKQITTGLFNSRTKERLLMILQRYTFGSKSQHPPRLRLLFDSCLWYCKDIHLEANHNITAENVAQAIVAYDIAKIYIWKQITTLMVLTISTWALLMVLQR